MRCVISAVISVNLLALASTASYGHVPQREISIAIFSNDNSNLSEGQSLVVTQVSIHLGSPASASRSRTTRELRG